MTERDLAAYCSLREMPKQRVQTQIVTELDPKWKEGLRNCWWKADTIRSAEKFLQTPGTKKEDYEKFYFLHRVLLIIGGAETCFPPREPDLQAILDRGRFFNGRSRTIKGRPCQCHRNSCELWKRNYKEHKISICTGYALSNDGLWRQHSWLLLDDLDGKKTVIETTVKRKAYYGFVMTEEEAKIFCQKNC